jgi:hypothetical protein
MDHQHPEPALGSATWVRETAGWLTPAERRSLVGPLVRAQVENVTGRLRLGLRLHPGRRAFVPADRILPPDTALTRAAEAAARRSLPAVLLNHSFRTYTFGRTLGEVHGIEVDAEVLFAAAMLHDVGLVSSDRPVDFTMASMRASRHVAEEVGLSTAATEVMETAIALHHTPGVDLSAGPVAYLLSAGAAVDVVGLRSWELPTGALRAAVDAHPREGFKREFGELFRLEAARVQGGRARFLFRYGAFGPAIRLAPFAE